jgi:cysteine desulfurase
MRVVPVGTDGLIDLAALTALLDERVALVSVQAANHEIGTIQPITTVAAAARAVGALFHCDASQAPGLVPLALADGPDLVTLSAHKIHGPQGIGALVVRPSPLIALTPLFPNGDPQRAARAGTPPLILAAGFAAAASAINARDLTQLAARRDQLATGLASIAPAFTPTTPNSPRLPHVLHGQLPNIDTALLAQAIGADVIIGTGAACAVGTREPSPLLKGLGWAAMNRACSLRLSVGADTTAGDIDRALMIIANALKNCAL